MGRIRILFMDHHAELGGGEISLFQLLKNIDRNRFDPIVYLGCPGPLKDKLRSIQIEAELLHIPQELRTLKRDPSRSNECIALIKSFFIFKSIAAKAERLIQELRPGAVYFNSVKSACYGIQAAGKAGVKSIWRLRDCLTEDFYSNFWLKTITHMTRHVDKVLCNSEYVKNEYLNLTRARRSGGVDIVYNGVDLKEFNPQLDRGKIRRELSLKDECLITLAGRLEPWKGQLIFVEAAREAIKRNANLRFVIAGGALFGRKDFEDKVKSLINEHRLENKITLLGFRDDMPSIIAASDIIIHPSYLPEPFGRDIVEAMACAKPVICTNIGGPKEIISEDAGIFIEPKRPDLLAEAILGLVRDPGKMKRMGSCGRRLAEEKFSIEKTARKTEAVIESLL